VFVPAPPALSTDSSRNPGFLTTAHGATHRQREVCLQPQEAEGEAQEGASNTRGQQSIGDAVDTWKGYRASHSHCQLEQEHEEVQT